VGKSNRACDKRRFKAKEKKEKKQLRRSQKKKRTKSEEERVGVGKNLQICKFIQFIKKGS
jgi:hypothetical protein